MLVSQFTYLLEAFNLILNLLIFMFFRFIYYFTHMHVLPARIFVHRVCAWWKSGDLGMIISYHVGTGN